MITDSVDRKDEQYVQCRTDYSFVAEEGAEGNGSADRMPLSMIVYQMPYFTETLKLRADSFFLSYPSETEPQTRRSDEEYLAAAQRWGEGTLKITEDEILEDSSPDPTSTEEYVEYQLLTKEWTVFLQMDLNGRYCRCGIYRGNLIQTDGSQ